MGERRWELGDEGENLPVREGLNLPQADLCGCVCISSCGL